MRKGGSEGGREEVWLACYEDGGRVARVHGRVLSRLVLPDGQQSDTRTDGQVIVLEVDAQRRRTTRNSRSSEDEGVRCKGGGMWSVIY